MKTISYLAVAGLLMLPALALAHAELQRATPKVGATVKQAPTQIELWYSEALQPHFCHVRVTDQAGHAVATGKLSAADSGKALILPLRQLAPGHYQVHWKAVSVDTHVTQGSFSFSYLP